MKASFKLCKSYNCGVVITGLEKDDQQYLNYIDSVGYRYEDCVTINVMSQINSQQATTNLTFSIDLHEDDLDETEMKFPTDGLYKITHIILPKRSWVEECKKQFLYLPEIIYIYEDDNIVKLKDGSADEIVELNLLVDINSETLCKDTQYTFCTCRLQECYYDFCRDYFAKLCNNKCLDIKNRDILWIGIHTIKYLLELGRLHEAQGVLETLTGCSGVCKQNVKLKSTANGCGCFN